MAQKETVLKRTHYEVLQVHPRADGDVIKAAYHALMKKFHPDRDPDHKELARKINEAYEVLSDEDKRKEYDQKIFDLDGIIIGEYRVLRAIAEGTMGRTYEAEHLLIGEKVCVKHCSHVSALAEEILFDEARAIWDLRHYAIPAMRNVLKLDDGTIALIMSYVAGPTLFQIVEKNGRMDSEHVAWITERLLNALSYLHHHGVIHGDIKPQNIIVQPDKHMAVLVDFGLSRIKPAADSRSLGYTELFAPPEAVSQKKPLLPESDFFSLGKTMLYALNGGSEKHVQANEIPDNVPDPLCRFIASLIKHNPLQRPNWGKLDLCEIFQKVRVDSFGRKNSGMKPIPNFSKP